MDNSIQDYIFSHNRSDYQRNNFDSFLDKIKFSYNVPSIHIAGTNGKGTTALTLANIYSSNNYKVGLFSSPYLFSINELISINGINITDKEISDIVEPYKKLIDKYNLSQFEIETFVALCFFQKSKVDIAVIECGMGGEDDATNIFKSILSIVTTVSLEHTAFLGKTISEIARNKAGIIKYNTPVLIGSMAEEAQNSIAEVASKQKSKICNFSEDSIVCRLNDIGYIFTYYKMADIQTKFLSKVFIEDCALAIEAAHILINDFPVKEQQIREGILKTSLPGRMEVLNEKPLLLVDGAHNPEAIEKLVKNIEIAVKFKTIHVVFASFRDKNIASILPSLDLISNDITITTFDYPRARTLDEYFLFAEEYKFDADYIKIINQKLAEFPNDVVLVTGSLAFVGRVINDYKEGLIKYEASTQK